MIDFTIETEIERTPAEVFAYVTDPTKLATWQTNTVSAAPVSDGPLRVGSRIREVHRAPGGKKIYEVVEVAEYEPDRVLGLRNIEGPPLNGRLTLELTERGTRFLPSSAAPRRMRSLAKPPRWLGARFSTSRRQTSS